MTNPQTSPPPPAPAYTATVPGRKRIFINGPIGVYPIDGHGIIDGLQSKFLDPEKIIEQHEDIKNIPPNGDGIRLEIDKRYFEANKNNLSEDSMRQLLALERVSQNHVVIPFEKIEGPEFPLDLLTPFTEDVTMVGNTKYWPKLENNDFIVPEDLDKSESIFYSGEEKRWDDNVGQYPPQNSIKSNEEFLEFLENLKDLAERQRLLVRGLFLLKHIGTDFVGRAGEL